MSEMSGLIGGASNCVQCCGCPYDALRSGIFCTSGPSGGVSFLPSLPHPPLWFASLRIPKRFLTVPCPLYPLTYESFVTILHVQWKNPLRTSIPVFFFPCILFIFLRNSFLSLISDLFFTVTTIVSRVLGAQPFQIYSWPFPHTDTS